MEFLPAYDFGQKKHEVSFQANGKRVNFRTEGDDRLSFHLLCDSVDFTTKDLGKGCTKVLSDGIVKDFELSCGETATFILNGEGEGCRPIGTEETSKLYIKTLSFWRNWVRSCTYKGRYVVISSEVIWHQMVGDGQAIGSHSETPHLRRNWSHHRRR